MLRRQFSRGDELWALETSALSFSEALIIDSRLNRNYFSAIPGIVTGVGLLFTFIAILVALLDVKMGQNSQIQGLPLLIEGLSGKFVSSIAALFSATIFLFTEKPLMHRLSKARLQLVNAIDTLVPRLTPASILIEMQRDMAEQSVAFKSFNSDLSLKLRQSFSESMGPTIKQMVDAIDELNRLMRAAEAQKQESITGALTTAIEQLQQSITASLERMGASFTESLSGSARAEFANFAKTMSSAAGVLDMVRSQSETTQTALTEIVNMAKSSTADQLALGKSQVEDLTAVMRQFMTQLNESAGTSATQMAATLTRVVHDLSAKVGEISERMSVAMQENANKATGAASVVVERVGEWSSKSAEQLRQLLEQQKGHLANIKDVDAALQTALELFNDSLSKYAAINGDLRNIASEVSATAIAAGGATRSMQEAQVAIQKVASNAAAQVENLGEQNRMQKEVWESIQSSMERYRTLFAQTEKSAGDLLTGIKKHLENHFDVTTRGYEALVKTANEHFANAAQRLGDSVNQLDEYLQDLTETLEKGKDNRDGKRS